MAKIPMTYILDQGCDPINNRLGLTRNSKEKAILLTVFMAWLNLPATSYPKAFHGIALYNSFTSHPARPVYEWKFRSKLSLNDSIQFTFLFGKLAVAWTKRDFHKEKKYACG